MEPTFDEADHLATAAFLLGEQAKVSRSRFLARTAAVLSRLARASTVTAREAADALNLLGECADQVAVLADREAAAGVDGPARVLRPRLAAAEAVLMSLAGDTAGVGDWVPRAAEARQAS